MKDNKPPVDNRPASRFDRPPQRPGRRADDGETMAAAPPEGEGGRGPRGRPPLRREGAGPTAGRDPRQGPPRDRGGQQRPERTPRHGDAGPGGGRGPGPRSGGPAPRGGHDRYDRGHQRAHDRGGYAAVAAEPENSPQRNRGFAPPPADVVTGIHPVLALLRGSPQRVREVLLWSADPRLQAQVREAVAAAKVLLRTVEPPPFDDDPANPQGVAARVTAFEYADLDVVVPPAGAAAGTVLLVLDSITDPRNLGAILRSAAFFGVQGVILPQDRAAGVTPLVERIARGATATLPVVQVVNLARTLEIIKDRGVFAFGTALEPSSSDLSKQRWPGAVALVLGAEGTGLRPLVRKRCDGVVKLAAIGDMQSLNVSAFATLALHVVRSHVAPPAGAADSP